MGSLAIKGCELFSESAQLLLSRQVPDDSPV
jgi:hypothetical protein